MSFVGAIAWYRAPAGQGGDRPPPLTGWKFVLDQSRDGKESGSDSPDVRVTGGKLKEATAEAVFERGGGETDGGIVCKVQDSEWAYIRWFDEQFCDGTETCSNKMDEIKGCQWVVVTGSINQSIIYFVQQPILRLPKNKRFLVTNHYNIGHNIQ